jgi:hypothetical protein
LGHQPGDLRHPHRSAQWAALAGDRLSAGSHHDAFRLSDLLEPQPPADRTPAGQPVHLVSGRVVYKHRYALYWGSVVAHPGNRC